MSTKLVLNTHYVNRIMTLLEINHAELANKMGISRNTLRRYLRNPDKVTLRTITNMAEALGQTFSKEFIDEE